MGGKRIGDTERGRLMKKFGEVDLIETLKTIVETNTEYYRSDFQYDAEILTNAARNGEGADAEERTFLWISRCCGTWCLRERNVFLRGSMEYEIWRFYGEQDSDGILAYGIEVSGMRSGIVAGRLYELDFKKHVRHVIDTAIPADRVRLLFERGGRLQSAGKFIPKQDLELGKLISYTVVPNNQDQLTALLCQEHRDQERLGNISAKCKRGRI